MRQEQQPIVAALSAVDFKFRFQMTNAGTRHDCSVTIQAVSIHDATAIFRVNWPTIENLARRSLAANDPSDIRRDGALADRNYSSHQPTTRRLPKNACSDLIEIVPES